MAGTDGKKKATEYISPAIAGARLVSVGLDILNRGRRGVKVHWQLKVKFQYDKDYKDWPGARARSMGGTMSSGPEWDEDVAFAEAEAELKAAQEKEVVPDVAER